MECFWTLEDEANDGVVRPERILPDGCVELVLNFGARFQEHKDDGPNEPQPMRFMVGQMTRPMVIAPTGSVELLGIRFHPGGTLPFFRVPMHELTNRVVELRAVAGEFERDLCARVEEPPSLLSKIAAVEALLAERVRNCNHDSWLTGIAAKIVHCRGRTSVDRLAIEAGVSSRQLERRFLHEVGIGPKLLCRILRFQQVFRVLANNQEGWAAVAADCGYYDQAHLIRDFQQFAKQTPAFLFQNSSALTQAFTREHRVTDFSNTSV